MPPRMPQTTPPSLESIDGRTQYCAVLGWPVRHSASPAMQNAGIACLGLNWRYLAFEVPPSELGQALAGAKALRFIGLNLTVPHKLMAVDIVDWLDDSARKWGAVNTIRFEAEHKNGAWLPLKDATQPCGKIRAAGFNTDADAISRALVEDLGLCTRDATILLLGAGGAGRTAALKLAEERPRELFLVNRTNSKAEAVAAEVRARCPGLRATVGYPPGTVDLVLNATSLGLRPEDELPFDERCFALGKAGAVYDMIYRPAETRLLKAARANGCRTANGLGMLLYQGTKALEIWSGATAPETEMRAALERNVYGHSP